jgi:DNA mismatch endonuclease (patch repair protein)
MAEYPRASSPGRSANMRAIRRTDTKPEIVLRQALHKLGYRYRKDYRLDLDGGRRVRPDIAFTARRVAVFVDGCFWHACPEHGRNPAVNDWYWAPKLRRNVERDRTADETLAGAGWQVVRIWEHVGLEDAVAAVIAAVGPRDPSASITDPSAGTTDPSADATGLPAGPHDPSAAGSAAPQPAQQAGPG